MNPVHQYEPHDAPDPMTRNLVVGLVFGCAAALGAIGVLVAAAAWVLGW